MHSLHTDNSISDVGLHARTSSSTLTVRGKHLRINGIAISEFKDFAMLSINFRAGNRSYNEANRKLTHVIKLQLLP